MRSDHPKSTPVEEFRRHLRVLEREMVRQLAEDTGCCGVTLAQCHALLELSLSELSLTGLSAALDLDVSTLSRTVDGMVKCGFVERTEDASDRRSLRLRLTPSGRHKVRVINDMCNRYYGALLEPLTASDRQCIFRAVGLMAERMRQMRSGQQAAGCCTPENEKNACRSTRRS